MTHFAAAQLDQQAIGWSTSGIIYRCIAPKRPSGGSTKFDSNPRIRTPNHMALFVEIVVPNEQQEVVRDTELACNLETSTSPRHIAHTAIYRRRAVECDRAPLQGTQALRFASFVHCSWPASSNPWRSSATTCARRHDVVCDVRDQTDTRNNKLAYLSGSEIEHQKQRKIVGIR